MNEFPEGWAEEPCSQFVQVCFDNRIGAFENKRSLLLRVARSETFYFSIHGEQFNRKIGQPCTLLFKSHSCFKASLMLAMSGFGSEVYDTTRTCIEWAAYAACMVKDKKLAQIWYERDLSDDKQKACRSAFQHRKVVDYLSEVRPDLACAYRDFYETAINRGAHPNIEALKRSVREIDLQDRRFRREVTYLSDNPLHYEEMLNVVINAAEISKDVFMSMFKASK